ncbi:hypothetical protein ABZ943_33685, partial [Streptomyces rubiginosohelvolus]
MQRTRITAKLLVGLAVTAVSGCVSVAPGTVSSPPPGPGATGPAQDVAPQIVQPPAREGLEVVPAPAVLAAGTVITLLCLAWAVTRTPLRG